LLREATALRAAKPELGVAEHQQQAEKMNEDLTTHLRNRILRDDDNQRLLNGVGTQQVGGDPAVPASGAGRSRPTTDLGVSCVPQSSPANFPTAPVTSGRRDL
ncbi:MAG TPA: hypothetical protein VI320_35505, partial [Terracidiphilus sp.]